MTSSLVGDTFFGIDLSRLKTIYTNFRRSISKRVLLIEFNTESLTLAEAQLQETSIDFSHVRRISLPDDALDRGLPTEPRKMGQLLKSFCQENEIPAHRAAVVIPNDAIFTTVIEIPASIEASQALDHALSPHSGVQIPIQLDHMDVDLIPLEELNLNVDLRSYFLLAIPKKLVDRVLETLKSADLDLVQLQTGLSAQLQHIISPMNALGPEEGLLHLELNRNYTQLSLVSSSGPVRLSRLTSIRNFPDPPDDQASQDDLHKDAAVALIAGDSYLPLTELDLRRLVKEVQTFIVNSESYYPHLAISEVYVSGLNSAHPALVDLLKQMLDLKVHLVRPLLTPGVAQFSLEAPLVLADVGRLIGLGLSLLPKKRHLESSLEFSEQPNTTITQAVSIPSDDSIIDVPFSMIKSSQPTSYSPTAEVLERPLLPKPSEVEEDSLGLDLPELMSSRSHEDSGILESKSPESVPVDDFRSSDKILFGSSSPAGVSPLDIVDHDLTSNYGQNSDVKSVQDDESELNNLNTIFTVDADEGLTNDNLSQADIESNLPSESPLMKESEAALSLPSLSIADSSSNGESIPTSSSPIDLAEDSDEVPFSMADLMQSFDQNHVNSTQQPTTTALNGEEPLSPNTSHLKDDPTLWPSIQTDVESRMDESPS